MALWANLPLSAAHAPSAWYLRVYRGAVAWVGLPKTLGMSPCIDTGLMVSKTDIVGGKSSARPAER